MPCYAWRTTAAALSLLCLLSTLLVVEVASADGPPRVLPAGQLPDDVRLQPLKDLDGYFPFAVPQSPEQWASRAEFVKRQILVSQGLWPLPEKTPLNAVIHGLIDQGDYTVEKVYFESFPGFYVTGNLYRPKNKSGKVPGVLHPHGHWDDGRFTDIGEAAIKREVVNGAERFLEGGRSPLQARCVQIARMGCVCFHYDMLGYADSTQLSFELVHRFAKQRPEMNTPKNWGLYSPQAEARLQSVMGLQTWNSIRAVDFLLSLPEVDESRIAVSGASGGGTQTMLLAAVDPRIALAFPAVMVSTSMQGGCTCENASCLRVGTGNVEFAALFAPKPQGVTSADDWTKEMATKGFPELKALYAMLGAPNNVKLVNLTHFGHNYNYVSRAAYYSWLNQHFKLGLEEPVIEDDYKRLTREEMTVWDDKDHKRPPSGDAFERKLVAYWTQDAEKQLAALKPTDEASLKQWREVVGGGVDVLIGRDLPAAADVDYEQTEKIDQGDWIRMSGLVRNKRYGERLPMTFLYPKKWNGRAVIWADENGKAALFTASGEVIPEAKKLLDAGTTVIGVDLFLQGEFLADGKPVEKTRKVTNPREFAGYTFGYNHSLAAQRAHDLLTAIAFVQNHERKPQRIDLVGFGAAAPWVAAARSQAGAAVGKTAVDTRGFRFASLTDFHDPQFLPGGAKYGDLPGLLALGAPGELWVAGETDDSLDLVRAVYKASGAEPKLQLSPAKDNEAVATAIDWLLK